MKAYIYQAALWCETCAAELERRPVPPGANLDDEGTYDSDQYPKGPYGDGGGEADCPQHCDGCNAFLQNPLTPDGFAYYRETISKALLPPGTRDLTQSELIALAREIGRPELADWIDCYGWNQALLD